MRITFRLLFLIPFLPAITFAQFDKKVSFNASVGTFIPLGKQLDQDSIPYVAPNFKNGIQLGIGGEYNFTSRFSLGLNLVSWLAVNYKNPIATPAGKQDIIDAESKKYNESYLAKFSLGICSRYRLFRQAKFNPFAFAEVNINSYSGEIAPRLQYYEQSTSEAYSDDVIKDRYTILRYNAKQIETNYALGGNLGIGIDIKLSDSFTILLQSGYNIALTSSNENLRQNLNYINFIGGIRFGLFRSKSIL